jgi:hypothetical protein
VRRGASCTFDPGGRRHGPGCERYSAASASSTRSLISSGSAKPIIVVFAVVAALVVVAVVAVVAPFAAVAVLACVGELGAGAVAVGAPRRALAAPEVLTAWCAWLIVDW